MILDTKEIIQKEEKYQRISKNYAKLQNKYVDCNGKLQIFRQKIITLEKEVNSGKEIIKKLKEEKDELEKRQNQSKEFIKELEATNGQPIAKLWENKLAHELDIVRLDSQNIKKENDLLVCNCQAKDNEIKTLQAALQIKSEELQIGGDIKGGLLYELGNVRTKLEQSARDTLDLGKTLQRITKEVYIYYYNRKYEIAG